MYKASWRDGSVFAEGAVFVATKCAVGVPDRISVVEMSPSFTTVRRPAAEIGETAADVRLDFAVHTFTVAIPDSRVESAKIAATPRHFFAWAEWLRSNERGPRT